MDSSLKVAELMQDSAGVRDVLARELHSVSGAALTVHGLTIDYFRQSPTRIAAQYTLDLESGEGVRDTQVITVAHFTDGRMERQWQRLQEDNTDLGEPVGKFKLPGARLSSELQAVVQAFPFDARLPGLRRIVSGSPEIRQLVSAAGVGEIRDWRADVVRYRPDMRAMARVEVTSVVDDQHHTRRVFAKAYREIEEGQRAFNLLTALAEQAASSGAYHVPQPLAYDAALRTLILDEARGERLLDIVRRRDAQRAPEAIRGAAQAVAAMHHSNVAPDLLSERSPDKEVQFSDVMTELERRFPQYEDAIHALAEQIEAAFRPAPLGPTHYDLKQGHILVDAGAVTILDFDKMAMGDPLVDVANVVATLGAEREGSAKRAALREDLANLFVDEYFRQVPESWAALFPAHLARATLLEAATTGRGNRGRRGIARPEERIATALRRATEILAS